jgi:hypothetical protein
MSIVKSLALPSLALVAGLAGCSAADTSTAGTAPTLEDGLVTTESNGGDATGPDARAMGVHWTRDEFAARNAKAAAAGKKGGGSPLMTYHGGKIMTRATTLAIFKGTSWGTYAGDEITGMDAWYTGHSGSNYAKTVDEYTGTNGQVGPTNTHQGHIVDLGAESSNGRTAAVLTEVCNALTARGVVLDAAGNGYYALYSDQPRAHAGYCAWHSAGTCNGVAIQYAFFWKLDGDAGCDPQDTSGLHSEGLAAVASVSAHELSEARSDPASPGAWYDSSGAENGDKCAWTFGAPLVTLSNGVQWKLQGEWSNAAYNAGTGYPSSSGDKGCLSGL